MCNPLYVKTPDALPVAFVALGISQLISAQQPFRWTIQPDIVPAAAYSPYSQPAATFDTARGIAVYHPVRTAGGVIETCEWDGVNWTAVGSAQMPPSQLYGLSTMAFDPTRGTVVYSGRDGTSPPEQWEWDGVNWTPLGSNRFPLLPLLFDPVNQSTLLVEDQRMWRSENVVPQFVASVSTYGNGCGSVQLVPNSVPWIGQMTTLVSFDSTTSAAPPTWLAAGFAPVSGVFWPVPGCEVLQTADVIGLTMTSQGPTSSFDLPIPYLLPLRGLRIYLQAFAFAPGQNPASVVLSNGVELALGDN
jgi:hypothetical protein